MMDINKVNSIAQVQCGIFTVLSEATEIYFLVTQISQTVSCIIDCEFQMISLAEDRK